MSTKYDVAVLGGGPGGYVAAIRAAQLGLKTAVIEKNKLGGVCLNIGCIPSKALLKNAEVVHTMEHKAKTFGLSYENFSADYEVAYKRSRSVSDRLVKGVGFLMKKNNIEVFEGTGRLTGPNALHVSLNDGGETTVEAENIILATGSHTASLPFIEEDGERIISYIEAITQDFVPERAVIVGGGAIGVEFTYIWANYGSEVTLVELLPNLLPREDPECSKVLEKAYKRMGVDVRTGTSVKSAERQGDKVAVELDDGTKIEADQVMMAIGFKANVEGIGLEEVGVEILENGDVKIDDEMRTTVPSIFAIGDMATQYKLAHVASAMGITAAEVIAGHPTTKIDPRMMPRATYAVPQVASFGYTEEEAQEAGWDVNVGRFPFQPNGRALGLDERDGFVKIVADARYGEILGAHLVGAEVAELLPELTLAQQNELTAEEIARNVHAHPTLSEAVMEAAHGVEGEPIHI